MISQRALDDLRIRILSRYALLFLITWEEERWLPALREVAEESGLGFATWSITEGLQPSPDTEQDTTRPELLLEQIAAYQSNCVFVLKDFHPYLGDPRVVRRLRELIPGLLAENKTLLLMGPSDEVPLELSKDAVKVELPLPDLEELREELNAVLEERARAGRPQLRLQPQEEERLLKAVLGLTGQQARKALGRALLTVDQVDDSVYSVLVSEKKSMIEGSDLLEFQELREGVEDVGGLEALKDWLKKRAEAFSVRAQEKGIPAPKGVLLLGVQGCGKSLTARAVAKLLSFPLVRLDVSTLLSSDTGASEKNMRDVLHLMEMIAPAVLWLDEVEKGFAGAEGQPSQDAVMTRLLGRFLTWMQEHSRPVFVVATANSVDALPPEMLRRGRFDELFFIDLPNYHERKEIFSIHLRKRGYDPARFDLDRLAERTEGYSGAEIEQIVLAAIVETFGQDRELTDADLEKAREDTVPLSVTMEEKIFELREWARGRCRPATPDSRVLQMLEAEQREKGLSPERAFDEEPVQLDFEDEEWKELAACGDLEGALLEFVRQRDRTTLPEIKKAFAGFFPTDGPQGLALRVDPNVIVCLGLSGDLAAALSKLINDRRLFLTPAPFEQYGSIVRGTRLPLLQKLAESRQRRPVLFPVCLSDVAPERRDERLFRVIRVQLGR
ncbi:MAG: AAA family ATPase [Planctomycetes bacterium]|nr:AAA family ATPase [Planctomycetota bacterium]